MPRHWGRGFEASHSGSSTEGQNFDARERGECKFEVQFTHDEREMRNQFSVA